MPGLTPKAINRVKRSVEWTERQPRPAAKPSSGRRERIPPPTRLARLTGGGTNGIYTATEWTMVNGSPAVKTGGLVWDDNDPAAQPSLIELNGSEVIAVPPESETSYAIVWKLGDRWVFRGTLVIDDQRQIYEFEGDDWTQITTQDVENPGGIPYELVTIEHRDAGELAPSVGNDTTLVKSGEQLIPRTITYDQAGHITGIIPGNPIDVEGTDELVAASDGADPGYLDEVLAAGDVWLGVEVNGATVELKHQPPQSTGQVTNPYLAGASKGGNGTLQFQLNNLKIDGRGHGTVESAGTTSITMTAVTVVTAVQVDPATLALQIKTRTIYVPAADTESGWTDVVSGEDCTS